MDYKFFKMSTLNTLFTNFNSKKKTTYFSSIEENIGADPTKSKRERKNNVSQK